MQQTARLCASGAMLQNQERQGNHEATEFIFNPCKRKESDMLF
jgi:hypothetical protein